MIPCKFQTDATGQHGVMIYSEDRKTVNCIAVEETAETIIETLGLPRKLGKKYAMGQLHPDGGFELGEPLPDQPW